MGAGNSTNKKDAQSNAAKDFIAYLVRQGHVNKNDVPVDVEAAPTIHRERLIFFFVNWGNIMIFQMDRRKKALQVLRSLFFKKGLALRIMEKLTDLAGVPMISGLIWIEYKSRRMLKKLRIWM